MNLLTQDSDPDLEVLTQLPAPGATKLRGSNYSHDEDIQLCESWMNVSHDPIVGTEQPGKMYWKRITDNYNENKNPNLNERTASSLEHTWGMIQKECLKFQGYFEEVERHHPSGIPYTDYLMKAQARYSGSDPKGKRFPFVHCWLKVRHCEKFISLHEAMKEQRRPKRSTRTSEGEDPTPEPAMPPAKRDRPPGRKQSKEKLKRHEVGDEYVQVFGNFIQMKTEERKEKEMRWNQSTMLEERRLENEKSRQRQMDIEERRLQWEQEQNIMFCDVSTMDENQRAYVLAARAEIARAKVALVNAKMASISDDFSSV